MPNVILVDEHDVEIGVAEKLRVHERGLLHRAVSVFVLNARDELLLQRRARSKYHCGGLWSNTACGHPEPGEPTARAASRRLAEEMGIRCALQAAGRFEYRLPVGRGLTEHECDHVFLGRADANPLPDASEVEGWRWMPLDAVERAVRDEPARYTPWLPPALAQLRRGASDALAAARSG